MAQSMTDGYTTFGANFCFAPSGLWNAFRKVQEGELYIRGSGEVTATGFFKYVRPGVPVPYVTMVVDPSGDWWVSASGDSSFTVTFETTPYLDDFDQTGSSSDSPEYSDLYYRVGNWGIIL
jgi:hypothetical protein